MSEFLEKKGKSLVGWAGIDALEEIITFVIDEDEGWEVLHGDLPDRFHSELFKINHFYGLDVIFR